MKVSPAGVEGPEQGWRKAFPGSLLRLPLKIPISAKLYFVMEEAPFH